MKNGMVIDSSTTISTKVPLEELGPPGIPENLTVFVDYANKKTDDERLQDTSDRLFEVTGILSKAALFDDNIDLSVEAERGNSHVLTHPEAATYLIKTPFGEIELSHNSQRELAKAKFTCSATTSYLALETFHKAFSPFLDHISYIANIPIHLIRTECNDTKNHVLLYSYVNPHGKVTLNPHNTVISNRIRPLYSLYREAKNSNSAFYRFLCYYKILEGIYKHIRTEFHKEAIKINFKVVKANELIPDNNELRDTHRNLIGKSIGEIFNNRFRKTFRDEMAHYLLDDKEILNVSDFSAVQKFENELLLIEICARTMITIQENYEAQLIEASK